MKILVISFLSFVLLSTKGNAQAVKFGQELEEIMRIGEAYSKLPQLGFSALYQYSDSANQPIPDETMSGIYKMSEGRFWAQYDSTEVIQGFNFSLTVHHDSKLIMVAPAEQTANNLMQIPLLDSLYQANFVSSIIVTQMNDSTRKLNIVFSHDSTASYQMVYNSRYYLVDSINYVFTTPDQEGVAESNKNYIKVKFTNYTLATIDPDFFLESRFIYKDGEKLYKKPAYSNYQLMVSSATNLTAAEEIEF